MRKHQIYWQIIGGYDASLSDWRCLQDQLNAYTTEAAAIAAMGEWLVELTGNLPDGQSVYIERLLDGSTVEQRTVCNSVLKHPWPQRGVL